MLLHLYTRRHALFIYYNITLVKIIYLLSIKPVARHISGFFSNCSKFLIYLNIKDK